MQKWLHHLFLKTINSIKMDKIKFLKYLVLGLFLLNVLTISSLFFFEMNDNNRKNEHARPEKIIIDQLNFDKTQQEQYRKLITWHRNRINTFENQIKNNKQQLYAELSKNNVDLRTKDSLINNLSLCQKEIEITHFQHFEDIKKICKPNQVQDFINLTKELSTIFSKKRKPN
jgi:protein CpxP